MALDSSNTSLWDLVGPAVGPVAIGVGNYLGSQQSVGGYNQAGRTIQGSVNQLNPFIGTGQGADSALASLYGIGGRTPNYSAFYNSPGFQFAQGQGEQGIRRAAAASGGGFSSSTLAQLGNYDTGIASTQYQNYLSGLYGLTQLGANSGAQAIQGETSVGATQANAGIARGAGVNGLLGPLASGVSRLFGGPGSGNGSSSASPWTTTNSQLADAEATNAIGDYSSNFQTQPIDPSQIYGSGDSGLTTYWGDDNG